MKQILRSLTVAILLVSATMANASHLSSQLLLSAKLNGAQQNPIVNTDAIGVASFVLSEMRDSIYVNIAVSGLSGAIDGIHVHQGAMGTNGGVIFDLSDGVVNNRVATVILNPTNVMISDLLSGLYYVDVHTTANPSGEIRGQIYLETDWSMMSNLDGAQQSPVVVTNANGLASFLLAKDGTSLQVKIVVEGLSGAIEGAHIHAGAAGQNGGVLADLTSMIQGNSIVGELDPSSFIDELIAGNTYINIHTDMNPNGEIRGQIWLNDMLAFDSWLNGQQQVPSFATAAYGILTVNIPTTLDQIVFDCLMTDLEGGVAEGAHFHGAAAGSNGGVLIDLSSMINGNRITGSISGADVTPELINMFLEGMVYLNIHNTANGGAGEIRGQVYRFAREGYTMTIDGEQEVPSFNTPAEGAGIVTMDRDQSNVYFNMVVDGLIATAESAHFHKNVVGQNGGVAFDLTDDLMVSDDGASIEGFWRTGFTMQNALQFRNDSIYVNIHTSANEGAGEVRGQVLRGGMIFDVISGIESLNLLRNEFVLYPNPTNGVCNLNCVAIQNQKALLRMINATGAIVQEAQVQMSQGKNVLTLNTSSLQAGIYFVSIISGVQVITERLIVE